MRALALAVLLAAPASALEVVSDPRVELVGLVQQLAGDNAPGLFGPRLGGYGAAGVERFRSLRGHPAVERLKVLARRGFSGPVPAQYALYLSSPPALEPVAEVPPFFASAAGGAGELEVWRRELADFARAARFTDWYAATEIDRRAMRAELSRRLAEKDLDAALVGYLGFRSWSRWVAAPSAFFPVKKGSYWVVETGPGRPEVWAMFGPEWKGGRPAFGRAPELASALWREAAFSAAYVMVSLCPGLKPAPEVCAGSAGASGAEDCVERLWVEAALSRLRRRTFGAEGDKPSFARTRSKLFPRVLAALGAYESDRARWPDLVAFTGPFAAPLSAGGAAPACPDLGARPGLDGRRLGYYMDARKEAGR